MRTGGAGANFNLPDMVGVFAKGSATQTASTGGANSQTLTESQMPTHNHSINDAGHSHGYRNTAGGGGTKHVATRSSYDLQQQTDTNTTGITINDTGGSTSFDNQPTFLEMQYIIKT